LAERDYSGTPLTTKLGAKPGAHVVVYFTTVRFVYRKEDRP
jgi:hypothetical protein